MLLLDRFECKFESWTILMYCTFKYKTCFAFFSLLRQDVYIFFFTILLVTYLIFKNKTAAWKRVSMLFHLARSTKKKRKKGRNDHHVLQIWPTDEAAGHHVFISNAPPPPKKKHPQRTRQKIFLIRYISESRNEYSISKTLHHFGGNFLVVLVSQNGLGTDDQTVDTRSHRSTVPFTADGADQVIYAGESLRDTNQQRRRERWWCLYLLADLSFSRPVISWHAKVAIATLVKKIEHRILIFTILMRLRNYVVL